MEVSCPARFLANILGYHLESWHFGLKNIGQDLQFVDVNAVCYNYLLTF
jgi:hypothetical protein